MFWKRNGLVKREIDNTATVRQPPRRLPFAQRVEDLEAVEDKH